MNFGNIGPLELLMILVIVLNFVVTRLARGRKPQWTR